MALNSDLPPSTTLATKILRTLRRKRVPGLPSALLNACLIRAFGCLVEPLTQIEDELERMLDDGWVEKSSASPAPAKWELSRVAIRLMEQDEADAAAAMGADAAEPMNIAVCHHTDPEDRESLTALLCVDEEELDGWWEALDVECKADAFVQWSLGNDGRNSYLYIEPGEKGVPIVGEIGTVEKEARNA